MTHLLGERPVAHAAAGLERRYYAFLLDRLVDWGLVAVAGWAAYATSWRHGHAFPGLALVVIVALVWWLGSAALTGLTGASPGKAAAGLRVVDEHAGTPIGAHRALLRALVLGVATVPTIGLGLASLAWTAVADPAHRRRGWHDRLARSVVVDLRPVAGADPVPSSGPRHVVNLTAMRLVPTVARPGWVLAFDTGQRVPVHGLVLVGRRPEGRPAEQAHRLVALESADMSLSKTHAQVGLGPDGALVVMDRGSTNGSVLTRRGVSRTLPGWRPATLLEGDEVRFGDRRMLVSRASLAPSLS